MIVRTLDDLHGTDRETVAETWTSRRLLLADDAMGFSLHDTVLHAGTSTTMWYHNHVEAVYCVAGSGRLEDHETGEVHDIEMGTMYALDAHDRHTLHADTDLRMVCVFNPPVTGNETHDEHGAYPAPVRPAPPPADPVPQPAPVRPAPPPADPVPGPRT